MSRDVHAQADAFVADAVRAVAERMAHTGLAGELLRERAHLDPCFKDECERRTGVRPPSRTLPTADFPGLGPVDVVLERPRALIELKWAYGSPAKIFEGLWDALKLALLGPVHGYESLYLITGAPRSEWATAESSRLFRTGDIDALNLWSRPLLPRRGPNYGATVGADLVIGANGNRPLHAHATLAVDGVAAAAVTADYQLRAVRVTGVGELVAWPAESTTVGSSTPPTRDLRAAPLPVRVTQAWIVRTAPRLTPEAIGPFLHALRVRGWSESDIATRVRPYLPDAA